MVETLSYADYVADTRGPSDSGVHLEMAGVPLCITLSLLGLQVRTYQ